MRLDELFDVTIEFPIDGHAIFDTFVQMKCAIRARDGTVVSGEEHFCVHLTDGETNSENCLLIKGMSQFPRLDFPQSGAYTVISWIEDKDKNVLSPKSSSYFDVVPQEWQAFDIFRGLFSSKPLAIKRGEQLVSSIPAFAKLSQILKSMPMSSLREMVSHHAVSGVTFSPTKSRIPKIIHQVWMQGKDDLARLEEEGQGTQKHFMSWTKTWRNQHPTWEYMLWDENSLTKLIHEDPLLSWAAPVYDSYDHFIKKVDFGRYLLLYRFGGVALDIDFECIAPLDSLLASKTLVAVEEEPYETNDAGEKRKLTIAGQELLWSANNAFAASTKMHPFWLLVICEAMRRNDMDPRMHVLKSTGPVLLTQVIDLYRELYGSSSVTVLERSYLFPIDIKGSAWSDRHNCIQSGNCREQYPEAYGIHHFSQSWLEDYEKNVFFDKT